jgi:hypothetical protein
MSTPDERAAVVAALRNVAALLESDEMIPVPSGQGLTFWAGRIPGDPMANAVRIAAALAPAGSWSARQKHYGDRDFLELFGQIAPGWRVDIEIPLADAGTEAGRKTVSVWEPKPEITALLSQPADMGDPS